MPLKATAPTYYRKEPICADECTVPNTQEVFKNVECCRTTPTRMANTVLSPTYYTSNAQYLRARCRTFNQRSFHFNRSNDGTLVANCAQSCTDECREVSYKPNNAEYSTQGAVSSSNRIMRLKYDAITGNASGNCPDCNVYHGDTTLNTYFKDTTITCPTKYVWKNGKKIACS